MAACRIGGIECDGVLKVFLQYDKLITHYLMMYVKPALMSYAFEICSLVLWYSPTSLSMMPIHYNVKNDL